MVAERVAHERRDEGAEQRAGDTGEESAEPDDGAGEVRSGFLARRLRDCANHLVSEENPREAQDCGQ